MSQTQLEPKSSFSKNVLLSASGSAATIVLLFIETIFAARVLPQADFGVYVLLITNVSFWVMILDFGLKTSLTQILASSDRAKQLGLLSTSLIFRVVIISVFGVAFWLVQGFFFKEAALAGLAPLIPVLLLVMSFDELLYGLLQGLQKYKALAISQFIRSIARLMITVLLLSVFNLGALGLVYSWLISYLISVTWQLFVLPDTYTFRFHRPLFSEVFRFGLPIYLGRFFWFTSIRVNIFLLAFFLGPAAIAIFDVASRIPQAVQRFVDSYIAVYFPSVTSLLSDSNTLEAQDMFNKSLRLLSFFLGLGVLFITLFQKEIIVLLFSEKYAASAPIFSLIMLALHIINLVTIMGFTLTAAGYPWRSLAQDALKAVVIVLANALLIPRLGVTGAAVASVIAAYVTIPFTAWLLGRSGVKTQFLPIVMQTSLLLTGYLLSYALQPDALFTKLSILLVFVLLNVALSYIRLEDFDLLIPKAVLKRFRFSHG